MTPATLSALVRSARAAGWGLSAGASPRHLPPDVRCVWTPAGPVSADGRRLPGVLRYQGGELGVTRSDRSYQRLARVPPWALPTVLDLVPSSTPEATVPYTLTTRATEDHETTETILDAETATEAATEAAALCTALRVGDEVLIIGLDVVGRVTAVIGSGRSALLEVASGSAYGAGLYYRRRADLVRA